MTEPNGHDHSHGPGPEPEAPGYFEIMETAVRELLVERGLIGGIVAVFAAAWAVAKLESRSHGAAALR